MKTRWLSNEIGTTNRNISKRKMNSNSANNRPMKTIYICSCVLKIKVRRFSTRAYCSNFDCRPKKSNWNYRLSEFAGSSPIICSNRVLVMGQHSMSTTISSTNHLNYIAANHSFSVLRACSLSLSLCRGCGPLATTQHFHEIGATLSWLHTYWQNCWLVRTYVWTIKEFVCSVFFWLSIFKICMSFGRAVHATIFKSK